MAELGSEDAGSLHAGQEGVEERIGSWLEVAGVWRSRGCRLVQLGLEERGQEGKEGKASVRFGRALSWASIIDFFPSKFWVYVVYSIYYVP